MKRGVGVGVLRGASGAHGRRGVEYSGCIGGRIKRLITGYLFSYFLIPLFPRDILTGRLPPLFGTLK